MSHRNKKEVIKLSFGPNANSVSSHLCNLEGLASTRYSPSSSSATSTGEGSFCDPSITHRLVGNDGKYHHVPRTLFIDTPKGFESSFRLLREQQHQAPSFDCWDGKVTDYRHEGSNNNSNDLIQNERYDAFKKFYDVYDSFAMDFGNRIYECDNNGQRNMSSTSSSASRHFNWDDLGEEEEEEDDDLYYNNGHSLRRKEQQKILQLEREKERFQQYNDDLSSIWNDNIIKNQREEEGKDKNDTEIHLSWLDYLMPPLPPKSSSMLSTPFLTGTGTNNRVIGGQSHNHDHPQNQGQSVMNQYDSFFQGYKMQEENKSWMEDVLLDTYLRKMLEDVDYISGFQLMVDNFCASSRGSSSSGVFAGMATHVLEHLQDECKSAPKFSVLITSDDEGKSTTCDVDQALHFRQSMDNCFALNGLAENSDLVLPINQSTISSSDSTTLFESSAMTALALESATLPYRLEQSPSSNPQKMKKYPISIAGSYISSDTQPQVSLPAMNMRDFVTSLLPSSNSSYRHVYLGLQSQICIDKDGCEEGKGPQESLNHLLIDQQQDHCGDKRMRSTGRQQLQRTQPGSWIRDGSLSNLSYFSSIQSAKQQQREEQRHDYFSIAASFRPSPNTHSINKIIAATTTASTQTSSSLPLLDPIQLYTQPLITSLIHRGYAPHEIFSLPDKVSSCIVPQSVSELIHGSGLVYWNSILSSSQNNGNRNINSPIGHLSVLSNSTQSFDLLDKQHFYLSNALYRPSSMNQMKKSKVMLSSWRAFLQRDIQKNRIMEHDECMEVLEYFEDARTLYEPRGYDDIMSDDE